MSERRKFTLDDFWAIKYFGTIAVSPDGRHVAYVLQSSDKASNEDRSAIWLLQLDEDGQPIGQPRQLTNSLKSDSNPVWAPDSQSLLFLSNREGEKNQLWCIDTSGGEAYRLTNMLRGVSEAAWSPDRQWIAFTASTALDDDDDLLTGRKTESANEKKRREDDERIRLRTITSIYYRLDGRGLFDTFSHVFVMPAPAGDAVPSDPASIRHLTSGDIDHALPGWAPDSSAISALCNREESRHRSIELNDFWLIDRASGEARCLTDHTLGIASYSWSPDGRSVVLVAAKDELIYGCSTPRLVLVAREDGSTETLTPAFDHETLPAAGGRFSAPGHYVPQWSADGRYLYFVATERGCAHIARLDMTTKAIAMLTSGEHLVFTLALLPNQRHLLITQEHAHHFSTIVALPETPSSWTYVLEQQRVNTETTAAQVAFAQLQQVVPLLPPNTVAVLDRGYDSTWFWCQCSTLPLQGTLIRLKGNRCFSRAAPAPTGKRGAPRLDGAKLQPNDPATHGNPDGTWQGQDGKGRPIQIGWWKQMHVKTARWLEMAVIQVIRPHAANTKRDPRVSWFVWIGDQQADMAQIGLGYTRRFSQEHGYRFEKQALLWEQPRLRTPEQFERWTHIVAIVHNHLLLARDLVTASLRPWETTQRVPTPIRLSCICCLSPDRASRKLSASHISMIGCSMSLPGARPSACAIAARTATRSTAGCCGRSERARACVIRSCSLFTADRTEPMASV